MKCEKILVFGDDFGDNECTFHCQLDSDHIGPHQEINTLCSNESYALVWELRDNVATVVEQIEEETLASCLR